MTATEARTSLPSRRNLPSRSVGAYGRPMRFGLLGSLEASGEDGPVTLGGPKQRIVLAHLVLGANRVVSAEHLIDALWGEDLPEDPKSTLQVYVSRLRSALGPDAVEAQAPGYVLRADRDEVDALRFEDLLGAHAGTAPTRASPTGPAEALELWRGPALADLSGEPSLRGDRAARGAPPAGARGEDRGRLDLGRHVQVIAELEGADARPTHCANVSGRADARLVPIGPAGRGPGGVRAGADRADGGARDRSVSRSPTAARADPSPGPRARSQGRAAAGLSAPGADRRGGVRRRLSRHPAADRARGRDQGGRARAREPSGLRPSLRARGADRRQARAPAHRAALRLLARAGRRVSRHAVPSRRQRRGPARVGPLEPERRRRSSTRSRRRSRRRIARASCTGT